MFDLPDSESDACRALCRDFGLELICVTKGSRGCTVHDAAGSRDIAGRTVTVADTVGSGDAFSAGLLVRLLSGDGRLEIPLADEDR